MPPYFEASNGQPPATKAASAAPQPVRFVPVTCIASAVPFAPPATGVGLCIAGVTMPMLVSCEKSQRPTAFATLAVVNVALPSSALTIASVVPSPCGKGHAQLAVGQHIFEPSQVVVVAPPLPPFVTVLPPEEEEVPAEFEEVPPEVALPLPPDAARLSLPLPPHADAKAAAPESSTATAQKLEFEEVRMGSTDHLSEHSSQCTEWIPTCI